MQDFSRLIPKLEIQHTLYFYDMLMGLFLGGPVVCASLPLPLRLSHPPLPPHTYTLNAQSFKKII